MNYNIILSPTSEKQLHALEKDQSQEKRAKAVKKAISFLAANPKHPGLHTHEFTELTKRLGYKIFEAYAENNTPGAYRVFWRYGPEKNTISIISIVKHP